MSLIQIQHWFQRSFRGRSFQMQQCFRTFKSNARCIILIVVTLLALYYLNTLRYFTVRLTPDERDTMLKMLKIIDTKFTDANIDYMMMYGTLLGSYRHHGFIPWDDDIDILVNIKDVKGVTEVLAQVEPEFKIYRQTNGAMSWRFHPANTKYPKSTFPFIDLQFFLENGTHLWPIQTYKTDFFYFLKSKLFPARRRPFENLMLQAPCDVRYALQYVDLNLCVRRAYFHKLEIPEAVWEASVWPCSVIERWFPFVKRTRVDGGWNESLMSDGKVIGHFMQKDCPITS